MKATQRLLTTIVVLGLSAGSIFASLPEDGLGTVFDTTFVIHYDEALANIDSTSDGETYFANAIVGRKEIVFSNAKAQRNFFHPPGPPDDHWKFERLRRADVFLSEPQAQRGRGELMYLREVTVITNSPGSTMAMEAVVPEPAVAGLVAGLAVFSTLLFHRFRAGRKNLAHEA